MNKIRNKAIILTTNNYTSNRNFKMVEDIEKQLKELILDDDFTSLQNLVNEEVNLMDILDVSKKELQHSNFLAWFFNPNETHNLGDYALKEFIKIYYKENEFQDLGNDARLSVFDFVFLDFDDLEIRREYKNIDLLFLSRKNEFCITIENKIYAKEGKEQLQKYRKIIDGEYPNYKRIYIFLSLQDQEITESEQKFYVQLNYEHIIKLLEQIISSQRLKIAVKTKFVFEQYLQTLKSMLNKNEEIEKVAQQLYKKYKSAFDLVYKYTSNDNEIATKLKQLIEDEKSVRLFHSNNRYLRFQPNFLYDNIDKLKNHELLLPTDDLTNNWVFLYQFKYKNGVVKFECKIGKGDQQTREKVYKIYMDDTEVYNKVNKPLTGGFHQAFQKEILSKKEVQDYLDNDDTEELENKLSDRFREIIDKVLPNLLKKLNEEINK